MKNKTMQYRFLSVLLMGGLILTSSVGCVSSGTYKDIIETSVKTVAATLLDIIVIDNLEGRAGEN